MSARKSHHSNQRLTGAPNVSTWTRKSHSSRASSDSRFRCPTKNAVFLRNGRCRTAVDVRDARPEFPTWDFFCWLATTELALDFGTCSLSGFSRHASLEQSEAAIAWISALTGDDIGASGETTPQRSQPFSVPKKFVADAQSLKQR